MIRKLLPRPLSLLIFIRPPSSSVRSRMLNSPTPEVSFNPCKSNPRPRSDTQRLMYRPIRPDSNDGLVDSRVFDHVEQHLLDRETGTWPATPNADPYRPKTARPRSDHAGLAPARTSHRRTSARSFMCTTAGLRPCDRLRDFSMAPASILSTLSIWASRPSSRDSPADQIQLELGPGDLLLQVLVQDRRDPPALAFLRLGQFQCQSLKLAGPIPVPRFAGQP